MNGTNSFMDTSDVLLISTNSNRFGLTATAVLFYIYSFLAAKIRLPWIMSIKSFKILCPIKRFERQKRHSN